MVQAIGRADPHAAIGSGGQREDDLAQKAVFRGVVLKLSTLPAVQAVAVAADPHGSVGRLSDGSDDVIGERRDGMEALLPQNIEAAGLGPDPEIAFTVFEGGQYAAGAEGRLTL